MSDFKISHDDDIINSNEGFIFNPYNSNNMEITLNQVQSILTKYGVKGPVHNMALYKRAFVHKSYTKRPQLHNLQENITIMEQPIDCLPLHSKSNERLERASNRAPAAPTPAASVGVAIPLKMVPRTAPISASGGSILDVNSDIVTGFVCFAGGTHCGLKMAKQTM